jgi:hypothetical protein
MGRKLGDVISLRELVSEDMSGKPFLPERRINFPSGIGSSFARKI